MNRITIVGGGTSGYMTAFHLAKNYPSKQITWIFPEENDIIGVGEALVPAASHFMNALGITHQDIIKNCNGTIKLGIKFDGFNREGEVFDFPFGISEGSTAYNTSSINYIIATEKIPSTMLNYPDISTHFRAGELLKYMDTLTGQFDNLTIRRERVTKAELDGTYDLLIDSTGFRRIISYEEDNFLSIEDKVPNNKAFVFRHPYTDKRFQMKPYSTFKAMDHGWIWHIPLGDQLAMGYVHHDKYDVKDTFIRYVEQKLHIKVDPSMIGEVKFKGGRNKVHMKNNVVAIGLASSFIEPLESTGLYLVTSAVHRLCDYIDGKISEQQYNEQTNENFDRITNFILAHYAFSKRDNEYWNHYKKFHVDKYSTTDIFPPEAWDFILAGFFDDKEPPKYDPDPRELINIHRGTDYREWLDNARNTSQIS